jgi:large subunit ribosomal protein L25
MKTVSLSGSSRENVGKKDATLLRREGKIPSVLYGGKEQVHFHISENDAKKIIFTPNVYVVELEVNGSKVNAIIKDVQLHSVTDRVIHIDFLEIMDGAAVKIKIPVKTTGFSIGVRNGGKLSQNFRSLLVEGKVADLPDTIEVDITAVKIGHKIRVSEMNVPGLRFLDPAGAVVLGVAMSRGASMVEEEEEEEEEAVEEGVEGAEEEASE